MKTTRRAVLALLVMGTAACQDLNVVNENVPDRARALGEPDAVENVIKSAFLIWYNEFDNSDMYQYFPIAADEMTQTLVVRNVHPYREPREVLKNQPNNTAEQWIQRSFWDAWNSAAANANDGMIVIDGGMKIMTLRDGETAPTDNTHRAYVFGKFMQGLTLGYLALAVDRVAPATEDIILPTAYDELIQWEIDNLKPSKDVLPIAMAALDEAIKRIDDGEDFTIPQSWFSGGSAGTPLSKTQLREMINTVAARLLVYSARTPAERTAVDWQRVLRYTQAGMTYDYGPTWATGVLTSTFHDRIQASSRMRADYRLVGPADVSGAYQAWHAKPIDQRDRFNIVTPDRRITGPTPTSSGTYFRYRQPTDNNGFDVNRGLAHFSNYQWFRYAGRTSSGMHILFSADENRLLRAEAMLRTGNLAEAANLINVTRTRTQRIGTTTYPGLPAVTAAGVPNSATCVPKRANGTCGSLMDALRYERQIELAGQDPVRAWMDYRGFGQLGNGVPVHVPIAGRFLVTLKIPIYSFGGVGQEGGAVCALDC